jgi:hypothetical protein
MAKGTQFLVLHGSSAGSSYWPQVSQVWQPMLYDNFTVTTTTAIDYLQHAVTKAL